MVRIRGGILRVIRERQGVTQLYLATGIGVTTETISRWERQDAPTLKEENALKLAEVLDVPLSDLYISTECETRTESSLSPLAGISRQNVVVIVLSLLVLVVVVLFFFFSKGASNGQLSAKRIIPAHTAPGQIFPVLIEVEPLNNSLLLKEQLPAGCSVVRSAPQATTINGGSIKWVARSGAEVKLFSYLAQCTPVAVSAKYVSFEGLLLVRKSSRQEIVVTGANKMEMAPYHWADSDKNNIIDDEELLVVYDDFDRVQGLQVDVDEVESIWMGAGYRWDLQQLQFVIIQ